MHKLLGYFLTVLNNNDNNTPRIRMRIPLRSPVLRPLLLHRHLRPALLFPAAVHGFPHLPQLRDHGVHLEGL